MTHEELASEMSAARKRRQEATARAIRDARVLAVRSAVPPGASYTDIEERARSFYPRLAQELITEVASIVVEQQGGLRMASVDADAGLEADIEDEIAAEL